MRCPVCGERGFGGRCKLHKKDVCACCHMCTETAMPPFVTCEHYREAKPPGKK